MTERDWADAHLVNAVRDIHAEDTAFRYRFIADEHPDMGIVAGEDRVQRLAAAKERPGPSAMAHQTGPPIGHHDLDREDLPPPAPAKTAGETHAHRI